MNWAELPERVRGLLSRRDATVEWRWDEMNLDARVAELRSVVAPLEDDLCVLVMVLTKCQMVRQRS